MLFILLILLLNSFIILLEFLIDFLNHFNIISFFSSVFNFQLIEDFFKRRIKSYNKIAADTEILKLSVNP